MDITNFFDWQYLATFAGAVVATGIITQALKSPAEKYLNLPTQVVAYAAALAILLLAQWFTGVLTLSGAVLTLLNALLVSGAASGVISGIKRVTTGKK